MPVVARQHTQQDKENVDITQGHMAAGSKQDATQEVLVDDEPNSDETSSKRSMPAHHQADLKPSEAHSDDLATSKDQSDEQAAKNTQPGIPINPEQASNLVMTDDSEALVADKQAAPPSPSLDNDEEDAVFVNPCDIVGHDPSKDAAMSHSSTGRSHKVESFARRISLKGVGTSLRRAGSVKSTPGSERGSLELADKKNSLGKTQDPFKPADHAVDETTKTGKGPASTAVSETSAAPFKSQKTVTATSRPAFRTRVSASAEGVKRAVLGSRTSAGSTPPISATSNKQATGIFRKTGASDRVARPASSLSSASAASTTTRPLESSLTRPTASSAKRSITANAKDQGDKPLPQAPASRSKYGSRDAPAPPKNTAPHPPRINTAVRGEAPKSPTGLSNSRARPATGIDKIHATGTGHTHGARSISVGTAGEAKSPTAAKMRASMTMGSVIPPSTGPPLPLKERVAQKDEAVSSSTSQGMASKPASRVASTATMRSASGSGSIGRTGVVRKSEMESKVRICQSTFRISEQR